MRKQLFILLIGALSVSACKKDETEEAAPSDNNNTTTQGDSLKAIYADADAIFVCGTTHAHDSVPFIGNIEVKVGFLNAYFGLQGTTPPYADAGEVKMDTTALNKSTDNYYGFASGLVYTQILGLSEINWNSNGNSGSGFPAFDEDIGEMPLVDSLASSHNISYGSSYQLSYDGQCSLCDSVVFKISAGGVSLKKTINGGATSVNFSAAEMGTLSAGEGEIAIEQWHTTSRTVNGKKFYFIKLSMFNDAAVEIL